LHFSLVYRCVRWGEREIRRKPALHGPCHVGWQDLTLIPCKYFLFDEVLMGNHDSDHERTLLMRDIIVNLAAGASLSLTVTGCSVAMALSGNPEPNFKAFEIGSSRQVVETQLGHPIASQKLEDGQTKDTYQYEMGNSPNGHRALMNLYIDLATIGIWELFGTIIEARMGNTEETRVTYNSQDRAVAVEGYTPPEPTGTLKEAVEAQEKTAAPPATSK